MRIQILPRFLWIFLFQIFCTVGVSTQCLNDQRSLLLKWNSSLVFASGLLNWDQSVDCCKWEGITCDGSSGHVTGLEIINRSISGGLDNSNGLFGLQYLQKLNLAFNNFNSAQIPTGIQNLANLTHLNLSNAGFGGQIPIELSKLKNLVSVDLSSQFQMAKPLKLENPDLKMLVQNLTLLKEIYLDSVNISTHGIDWYEDVFSSLPKLRNLSLRGCGLSGALLPSLSKLQSLSVLQLDRNNLSTTVPDFFADFSGLTTLTLSSNSLQGTFPDRIFSITTLQNLDLAQNFLLKGTISQFSRNASFRTIVLSYTIFSGSLPTSISNLKKLSRIELSNCNFTGSIPSIIGDLTELEYLDFSFNSFSGSIPHFQMSKRLVYIDLSRNSLTGSLSLKHFGGLSNLSFVHLGLNLLSGSVPVSIFRLPSLQKLYLLNNEFSGHIGEFSPLNSSKLDTLDLSSNRLEGSIPEAFFKHEGLNVLSLSSNNFTGSVELEKIQNLRNLARLELGHNNLTIHTSTNKSSSSQFPQLTRLNLASCNLNEFPNLRNQSMLRFLDLSNNNITGDIPSWIWEIGSGSLMHLNLSFNRLSNIQKPFNVPTELSVLDLHSNNLQGEFPIPPQFAVYIDYSNNSFEKPGLFNVGNITLFASFFSLARNKLNGPIPLFLCNATELQVLDLSENYLIGSIPSCLVEKTRVLGVLNLGRNNLTGDIPNAFSVNCSLRTLDLSRNNLGGKIPASLASCRSLEVLNVWNNKINDTFPCMLKISATLRVLVLRSNRFHGDLSCFGVKVSWPSLQIIDIASNNFSGKLSERCVSSWRGMALDNDANLTSNHLRYDFLALNNFYYQDKVTVTIRGLELEFLKILTVFTSMDFSCNNFHGAIPSTIGGLRSLFSLNLSHNSFNGPIPRSIGNLTQLESMDLSNNQLTGEIPQELTGLTFLSFLNLSYNRLQGMIPQDRQFSTFSSGSYEGNTGLWGCPLNRSCNSGGQRTNSAQYSQTEKSEYDWLFIFIGLGYGVGAAFIIVPLVFRKQWREKCSKQMDQFLKLIFPRYGFSYIRCDGKVAAAENIENDMTDDDDDEDSGQELSSGRYCVFCTKLDNHKMEAMHNPKCTCHFSPPTFSSSPLSTSSSLLLLLFQHSF